MQSMRSGPEDPAYSPAVHRLKVTLSTIRLSNCLRKRLDGPELDGPEHFEKNCKKVPGDAGAAAGATAGAAAASAVCIHYVIIGGALRAPV